MKSDPTPKPPMSPRRFTRQASPSGRLYWRPSVGSIQSASAPAADVQRPAARALQAHVRGQAHVGEPEQELEVVGPAPAEGPHQRHLVDVDLPLDLAAERACSCVSCAPRPMKVASPMKDHVPLSTRYASIAPNSRCIEYVGHACVHADLHRTDLRVAVDGSAHAVDEHFLLPVRCGLLSEHVAAGKRRRPANQRAANRNSHHGHSWCISAEVSRIRVCSWRSCPRRSRSPGTCNAGRRAGLRPSRPPGGVERQSFSSVFVSNFQPCGRVLYFLPTGRVVRGQARIDSLGEILHDPDRAARLAQQAHGSPARKVQTVLRRISEGT